MKQKIESRFKLKKGYYLELLTLETIKLLGCTRSQITEYIGTIFLIQKLKK